MRHSLAESIHPGAYITATDPAVTYPERMQPDVLWLDTTASPHTWKKRNSTNDGWDTLSIGSAPTGAAGGSLDGTYPNPGLAASVAGAGLSESSNVLAVNVDDSTIEINTDTLRVKDAGITYAKLASSAKPVSIILVIGDETTAITTGTAKITFRLPFAMTLTSVRASLTTAQSSGSIFTVDINESGTTVLSTKLTIDNTEETSTTAATPAVISDSALADDAEITIDVDQVGAGDAAGLKVTLIGTRV